MSDQDVFKSDSSSSNPVNPEDILSSIVNEEGKPKYGSVDDALVALKHSQEHIAKLEKEALERKAVLEASSAQEEKLKTLEETLERLIDSQKPTLPQDTPQDKGLSQEEVARLIEEQFTTNRQQATREANQQAVNKALVEKYGDKTQVIVEEKARSLGKSVEDLGALAANDPKLVLELFSTVSAASEGMTPPGGTPPFNKDNGELQSPSKSVLQGATAKEQKEFMLKVKEDTYKRLGVEI